MTGYQSKKTAAQDKLAQPAQEPWPDLTKRDRESYRKGHDAGVAHHKQAVKAALAQPAQKPVATIAVRWHEPVGKVAYVLEVNLPVGIHNLYTTPPQRTWVGLTDEEMQAVVDAQLLVSNINVYFKAIEAKLKEKNNG